MARTTLTVCIGEPAIVVGTLTFEATGNREHSAFQYADSWLQNPRRFAIEPALPLDDARRFFRAEAANSSPLPRAFADTAPDSWGRSIISKDAKLNKERSGPLVEIDYLASVDDFSRMGALRFRLDQDGAPFLAGEPVGRHLVPPLLHLDQLGKEIADFERDEPDMVALRRLRQIGTPFGGARPKCSIIDADGSLAIAKFTSTQDTMAVERAEVMTLRLAQLCDIDAAQARIEMSAGLPVAIIKRFDRSPGGRRPFISAQTMLESPLATGATYAQLADAIRQHCMDPVQTLRELFKRIAFTILVSNVDDHLKNHGFLYAGGGQWNLSPVFDVNPAPERFRELKTAIADVEVRDASIELLMVHAFYFDVAPDDAAGLVSTMAHTIADNWQALATEAGMTKAEREAFSQAFDHRDAIYARGLKEGVPGHGQK
jgi:serine/threonine-protein kinase HipA